MYLTGIILTFFLAILLLGKKEKSHADSILSLWLVFIGIHLTLFYIFFSGKYLDFPYLHGIEKPLPLIHGPFLYLYTTSLTGHSAGRKYQWLHFLPVVLSYLLFIDFFASSYEHKIEVYRLKGSGYEVPLSILRLVTIISGMAYILKSLIVLRDHKRNIAHQFSYLEKINLDWLRHLIIGLCIIWSVVLLHLGDEYIFIGVVLYVMFIGYYGIKQVGIFTQYPHGNKNMRNDGPNSGTGGNDLTIHDHALEASPEKDNKNIKYVKSSLSEASAIAIHQKLNQIMEENKLYKNPELSLSELAEKLDVNPNTLSQVINSLEQKNFYDYVNAWRIQEFKQAVNIVSNQKFTLLALALECGFNSKSSFNRNFKKIAGISPSEYLSGVNVKLE
jgi:AraC-like DNA-binding protein